MRNNGGWEKDSRDENKWVQEDLFILLYIIRFYIYIKVHKVV